jgi:hypothetical protein
MSQDGKHSRQGRAPHSALLALARQAAAEGAYERIPPLYAAAEQEGVAPDDLLLWRRLLLEAGHFAAARRAGWVEEGEATRREGTPAPKPDGATAGDDDDFLDFEPGSRVSAEPVVPESHLDAFLRWFGGRGDVHARQWYDARRDRSGYWPVREPLSRPVIAAHLLGRMTVGQYVLHPDHTVGFAAIDFDPTPEALEQLRLDDQSEGGVALPPLADYARRVRRAAAMLGLSPALEDTGGSGLHLWLLFAPRIPAERARALLRELLWRSGPQPPAVAVEIFPKQDRLTGKGLGNLIKLPLGVHQVTLRRSRFLDDHMQPISDGAALASLCASDPNAIEELIGRRVVPLFPDGGQQASQAASSAVAPPPPAPSGPSPRALAEALAALPPGRESDRAADRILAGCTVVRQLARKAEEERAVSADEARALLYTVGLVGRENTRIETLFAQAGVSRKELERVRRGLQGPMGCRRLRERFAGHAASCACPLPDEGGYATPALFALRRPPSTRRQAPPAPTEIAADPTDASLPELQQRLSRIEAELKRLRCEPEEE